MPYRPSIHGQSPTVLREPFHDPVQFTVNAAANSFGRASSSVADTPLHIADANVYDEFIDESAHISVTGLPSDYVVHHGVMMRCHEWEDGFNHPTIREITISAISNNSTCLPFAFFSFHASGSVAANSAALLMKAPRTLSGGAFASAGHGSGQSQKGTAVSVQDNLVLRQFNFVPAAGLVNKPLIFGVGFWNQSGAAQAFKARVAISVHAHRRDLETFDPNR